MTTAKQGAKNTVARSKKTGWPSGQIQVEMWLEGSRQMTSPSCMRPEVLGRLRIRWAQPLMNAAEHAREALGWQIGGFSGLEEEVIASQLQFIFVGVWRC
jgi:hypothetical protein